MEAIISTEYSYKEICFLVPKINGKGYLKSPFGGHHFTKRYKSFKDKFENDLNDIDGMCSIDIIFGDNKDDVVSRLKTFLLKEFPYITGIRIVNSDEFYALICQNEGMRPSL